MSQLQPPSSQLATTRTSPCAPSMPAERFDATRELHQRLEQCFDAKPLTTNQVERVLRALVSPEPAPELKAAFLIALRSRGETPEEVASFARAMLGLARGPVHHHRSVLVDTCGTGGDGSNAFNFSTASALLIAALGIGVAKHGNRSVSSRSGSADVLAKSGVPFCETPQAAGEALDRSSFAFLFAPTFHPAMGSLAAVRRTLATRTVFNVLGPLVNPARPTHQLVGTFDLPTAELMAGALVALGVRRAFVVHGAEGWDEATPVGAFRLFDVQRNAPLAEQTVDPASFGLARCRAADLVGGEAEDNARILRQLFDGARGPIRDCVLLNSALVLLALEETRDPRAAVARAAQAIDDGRARALLGRLTSAVEEDRP